MQGPKNFTEIQKTSVFKCLSCTASFFCDGNLFNYGLIYMQTCCNHFSVEFSLFLDFIGDFVRLGGRFLTSKMSKKCQKVV